MTAVDSGEETLDVLMEVLMDDRKIWTETSEEAQVDLATFAQNIMVRLLNTERGVPETRYDGHVRRILPTRTKRSDFRVVPIFTIPPSSTRPVSTAGSTIR